MSDDHLDTQSLNIFRGSMEAAKKNREAMQSLEEDVAEEMPVASRGLKSKGANTPQASSVSKNSKALDAGRVTVTPKKAVAPNTLAAEKTPAASATPAAANAIPKVARTPKMAGGSAAAHTPEASATPAAANAIPKVARTPKMAGGSVAAHTPEAPATPAVADAIPKVARKPKVVGTPVPAGTPKEPEAPAKQKAAPAQAQAPEVNPQAETAGALVNQLAVNIRFWQSSLPDDKESNIVAILANGKEISIQHLASEGRHGLIIHGELNDEPCMIATHQTNLTLICTAVDKKAGVKRPELRFYVDGKKLV